jgi:hypothetical protein
MKQTRWIESKIARCARTLPTFGLNIDHQLETLEFLNDTHEKGLTAFS